MDIAIKLNDSGIFFGILIIILMSVEVLYFLRLLNCFKMHLIIFFNMQLINNHYFIGMNIV